MCNNALQMYKNVVVDFTPVATSMDWIFNGVFNKENEELNFFTSEQVENKIADVLSRIPKRILDVAFELGWKIIATNNRNLEAECGALGEIYGYTNFRDKEFVIYPTLKGINESLPHELAHLLDVLLNVSSSKEWLKVFNEEKEQYEKMRYTFTAPDQKEECFADAFMLYIFDEKRLEKLAPKTYKVIKNIFQHVDYLLNNKCIEEYVKEEEQRSKTLLNELTDSSIFTTSYNSFDI